MGEGSGKPREAVGGRRSDALVDSRVACRRGQVVQSRTLMHPRTTILIPLLLLVLLGGFFRFHDLGRAAYRADTMLLQRLAQKEVPPGKLLREWFEVSGLAGQMPMPAVIAQSFYAAADWPQGAGSVRFPYALMGLLAVPVAFLGGRRFLGNRFAVFFATLVALSSFHVAFSRQAYFYSPLLLGHFLLFWAVAATVPVLWDRGKPGWREGLLLAGGLFFSGYSQLTGLFLCVSSALLFAVLLLVRQLRKPGFWRNGLFMGGIYLVVLLPLLFVSWGLLPILQQIGKVKDSAASVVALSDATLLGTFATALCRFSWGTTWPGILVMLLVLASALAAAVLRRERMMVVAAWFVLLPLLLFGVARVLVNALFETRYLVGGFPFFLAILAYGLTAVPEWCRRGRVPDRTARLLGWVLPILVLAPLAYPAWLQTRLTGRPVPYHAINAATDQLPQGSPVLVDRWFEPWNELAAHPTTNVVYTFTVPSEPIETFKEVNWRETAVAFFRDQPDGAYLEIWKTYWDQPEIGPWDEPSRQFAQHTRIVNKAGVGLRKLGLAARSDYYMPYTNGVAVDLYFNTREDRLDRMRAEGRTLAAGFGPGWVYIKPYWMRGDFRGFRMLDQRASLEFTNLSDQPQQVMVALRAVAAGGAKTVDCAGQVQHTFQPTGMDTWQFGPITVPPGTSRVVLSDAKPGTGRPPLLVERIQAAPYAPPASPAPDTAPPPALLVRPPVDS